MKWRRNTAILGLAVAPSGVAGTNGVSAKIMNDTKKQFQLHHLNSININ